MTEEQQTYVFCPKCGGEVWDNRERKAKGEMKFNAPDFSCKNRDTCGWVFWPSKRNKNSVRFPRFIVEINLPWGKVIIQNNDEEILLEDVKWVKDTFLKKKNENGE